MSEERCEKHDMVRAFCADCRGLRGEEEGRGSNPVAGLLVERVLVAQYAGLCDVNPEHRFPAGEEVGVFVRDNDRHAPPFERVGYGCAECVEEVFRS